MDGVGTIIARWLANSGIRYEEPGCNCYRVMNLLDQAGPDNVSRNIAFWVNQIKLSSHMWYRANKDNITGQFLRVAIQPFENQAIEFMLKQACKQAKAGRE